MSRTNKHFSKKNAGYFNNLKSGVNISLSESKSETMRLSASLSDAVKSLTISSEEIVEEEDLHTVVDI